MLQRLFAYPLALALLTLLPALGVAALAALVQRRRALASFGRPALLASVRGGRRVLAGACLLGGLAFLALGIAGPRWGRDWEQATVPGRDLVVVLDLSRSMLAQDALGRSAPNRLGLARDALADLAGRVQAHGGHRLALVVFAARARVACPLTHDYDHFRESLSRFEPGDPRLEPSVGDQDAVSGTRIGAALRLAVEVRDSRFPRGRDILLVSDGDDPAEDGEWQTGMGLAREQGIPVSTVGVGDPLRGSPIPVKGGFLRYNGQEVRTRLREKPLEEIARETGGVYVPARTSPVPLGELFLGRLEREPSREDAEDLLPRSRPRYPWFFGAALVLLSLEMVLGYRRPRPAPRTPVPSGNGAALSRKSPVLEGSP